MRKHMESLPKEKCRRFESRARRTNETAATRHIPPRKGAKDLTKLPKGRRQTFLQASLDKITVPRASKQ